MSGASGPNNYWDLAKLQSVLKERPLCGILKTFLHRNTTVFFHYHFAYIILENWFFNSALFALEESFKATEWALRVT